MRKKEKGKGKPRRRRSRERPVENVDSQSEEEPVLGKGEVTHKEKSSIKKEEFDREVEE